MSEAIEVMCWAMVRATGVPAPRKVNEDPAWRYHEPALRAALAAAEAAGLVLVPVIATPEMVIAGRATQYPDGSLSLYDAWHAMALSAQAKDSEEGA